jgi:hypothetical protein
MRVFSVEKILTAAGGIVELRDLLMTTGRAAPSENVISIWKHRQVLPGKWTAPVLYALVTIKGVDPLDLMTEIEREPTRRELGL